MSTSPHNLWYYVALVATALATLAGGYMIGSQLESNDSEDKLNANQRVATHAVATLNAVATDDAIVKQNQIETLQAESTQAISAVTQIVQGQETATGYVYATQTAVVGSYTPTSTWTPTPTVTLTQTLTPTPAIPEARLLPLSVAVRLGPGLEYPVIDYLPQDTHVSLLGISEDSAWVQIGYGEEQTGFVPPHSIRVEAGNVSGVQIAQDFPTLTYTPSPTDTATWIPSPTHTITPTFDASPTPSTPEAEVFAFVVPVYAGPDETYSIVGSLTQGTAVQVLGMSADRLWLQIEAAEVAGFVRANTLSLTGGSLFNLDVIANFPTPTPSSAPPQPIQPEAVAAGQFVVVRAGPGYEYETLGVVSASETLILTGIATNGQWFQIGYAPAEDGLGWVSGEVVEVAGDLSALPAVAAPTLPTAVASSGGVVSSDAAAGNTSAGSLGPIETVGALPETTTIDYEALGYASYAYEVVVAVNGSADGANYQSLMSVNYAQSGDQSSAGLEVTGAFVDLLNGEDLGFLIDFLPLTIGTVGQQGYFYSETEDVCLDLGPDVAVQEINLELSGLIQGRDNGFMEMVPADAVFGVIDRHAIAGIPSVHYQLLGQQQGDEIVPLDEFKLDMWWTPDESALLGYRFTIVVDSELFFLYRDRLIEIDPAFADINTFAGTITLYQLPRGIDAEAVELSTPPSACDFIEN